MMAKPLFQRRHYEKFAELVKEARYHERLINASDLIVMFRMDNPKFNEAKFWRAIEHDKST
jgi:hypothetical protein